MADVLTGMMAYNAVSAEMMEHSDGGRYSLRYRGEHPHLESRQGSWLSIHAEERPNESGPEAFFNVRSGDHLPATTCVMCIRMCMWTCGELLPQSMRLTGVFTDVWMQIETEHGAEWGWDQERRETEALSAQHMSRASDFDR